MKHQHFSTRSWLRIKRREAPHWQISRTRWLKNLRKSLEEVAQGGPGGNSLNRQVWFLYVNKNKKLQIWKLCDFPKNVFKTHFFQNPGPCLLLSLLLSWHTWPLPQPSITWMSDCKLHISSFDKRTLHVRMYSDDKAIKTRSLHISSFDQSTLHVRMYLDYQGIENIVYICILRTIHLKTVKY